MYNVTIIIPVYCTNQQGLNWLDECLQSALAQECAVVAYDDGSTVNVREVLSKYNITYSYRDEHLGVSAARNACAELAKTSLILPLDCDDRLKPGAVEKLVYRWAGVPVYPDLEKFGKVRDPHYRLMDFHCDHVLNYVGFTSVNVLHSVEQHKAIGGWDTSLDFYEDGEYNARLLGTYCGLHLAEPLVEYRIHDHQRTQQYKKQAAQYTAVLLNKIRSYEMACRTCGGKRRTGFGNDPTRPAAQTSTLNATATTRGPIVQVSVGESWRSLPSEFEGRILARYVGGKGKGRHYYQGKISNIPYRVTHGDVLYADARDVRDAENTADTRQLVRIKQEELASKPEPAKVVEPELPQLVEEKVEPTPEPTAPVVKELPELSNMTVDDVLALDLSEHDVPAMIRSEARGKNRKVVISYLKNKVKRGGAK